MQTVRSGSFPLMNMAEDFRISHAAVLCHLDWIKKLDASGKWHPNDGVPQPEFTFWETWGHDQVSAHRRYPEIHSALVDFYRGHGYPSTIGQKAHHDMLARMTPEDRARFEAIDKAFWALGDFFLDHAKDEDWENFDPDLDRIRNDLSTMRECMIALAEKSEKTP